VFSLRSRILFLPADFSFRPEIVLSAVLFSVPGLHLGFFSSSHVHRVLQLAIFLPLGGFFVRQILFSAAQVSASFLSRSVCVLASLVDLG
jgi:hypothetical protein